MRREIRESKEMKGRRMKIKQLTRGEEERTGRCDDLGIKRQWEIKFTRKWKKEELKIH